MTSVDELLQALQAAKQDVEECITALQSAGNDLSEAMQNLVTVAEGTRALEGAQSALAQAQDDNGSMIGTMQSVISEIESYAATVVA